ncbi:hypothetical protein HanRHA438_Chr00c60g0859941 [Helianthus annuus]|uniref:Uncharacterized protein n=1 Tax=Helianthus annuus TaxID=4232 RepID=A0A9K3I9A4_HELAN|nr:hypothetical protein HanXRQr2_Chr09g0410981 [Helianthus annuus]KAJ0953606.1 hypothetical protein HanRHA438_Chr00c60g0859941 [Helianthus annuus]
MFGRSYDNRQYGWDTASPQYVRRDPVIAYDVPQSHNGHLGYDENRIVFEEERPVASYYPEHVVFEEQYSVPVHKNHYHSSTAPRKQVHFVEHQEKVTESFDSFGNRKVYKESVDTEADGFINRKHKNFESTKTGTFNSFY